MATPKSSYDAATPTPTSPQTTVDADRRLVDLTFDEQRGEQVYIEEIEINGNTRPATRSSAGSCASPRASCSAQRPARQPPAVTALGFFETGDIVPAPRLGRRTIVVTVNVQEKPTGTFQVGLACTIERFLLTARSPVQRLRLGRHALPSPRRSARCAASSRASYTTLLLRHQWIFSFDYFRQDLDYYGYSRARTAATSPSAST
jgi:outer membrane protein insertion porin family